MRRLLENMRERHVKYASMHEAAERNSRASHLYCTIAILVTTAVGALGLDILHELHSYVPQIWTALLSNVSLGVVGVLTAINNLVGYDSRAQQHREARIGHIRASELVTVACAIDDEDPTTAYDYTHILSEVQEIHDALKQSVALPARIARMYPEFEAPWQTNDSRGIDILG